MLRIILVLSFIFKRSAFLDSRSGTGAANVESLQNQLGDEHVLQKLALLFKRSARVGAGWPAPTESVYSQHHDLRSANGCDAARLEESVDCACDWMDRGDEGENKEDWAKAEVDVAKVHHWLKTIGHIDWRSRVICCLRRDTNIPIVLHAVVLVGVDDREGNCDAEG